jgi:asparagine synthase (glutamine-hydrolysing)
VSAIAGVLMLDGAPADPALLARMAAALSAAAPDGTTTWIEGPIGLAHARLRTGDAEIQQPFSVDERRWIAADARIDGRGDLVRALRAAGIRAAEDASAAALIHHALDAWGDGAVERLLGDFAFAAWDGERRRLVCARDPFGIKPLYYARTPRALVFASSIDAVRIHPDIRDTLDEGWIADFLVFGDPQSTETTVYADVRLLPPGHLLIAEDGRIEVRRWFALPEEEPLRLRGPAEYAETFAETLRAAVVDRLPPDRASILLSGGRDSTAIAASWRAAVDRGERGTALRGFTGFHARLMPDDEPAYTALAADALRIPVEYLATDDYGPFGRWEAPELRRPQPTASPLLAIEADQHGRAAAHARVLLTGQGGDALLRETPSRLTRLAAEGRIGTALREAAAYARWHRRLPRPGVRSWLAARRGTAGWAAEAPRWMAPAFAARVGLGERLAAWNARPAPPHPLRPEAARELSSPFWPALWAAWDPAATGLPIELRHPYFDLRLVRLALSIPPAQWYNDKGLLRIGMRGRLPARVLARPKTPLAGDPLEARLRDRGADWLGGRRVDARVAPWVDPSRVPAIAGGASPEPSASPYDDLRPLALSLWLAQRGG